MKKQLNSDNVDNMKIRYMTFRKLIMQNATEFLYVLDNTDLPFQEIFELIGFTESMGGNDSIYEDYTPLYEYIVENEKLIPLWILKI